MQNLEPHLETYLATRKGPEMAPHLGLMMVKSMDLMMELQLAHHSE